MNSKLSIQEFGLNKNLSKVIYNFILDNKINIADRDAELISKKFIKKIIERFGVTINGIVTTHRLTGAGKYRLMIPVLPQAGAVGV